MPVAVVGSVAIMYVVLFTTHGFSIRTGAALAGTLGGIAVTAVLGAWAVGATHLTGVTDEAGGVLTATPAASTSRRCSSPPSSSPGSACSTT